MQSSYDHQELLKTARLQLLHEENKLLTASTIVSYF